MRFDYDLSQAPSFKPLPDGTYIFRVAGAKTRKSQAGNEMIIWELEVIEPEEVKRDIPKTNLFQVITPDALGFIRGLFEACGKLQPGGSFDTDDLLGESFGAVVSLQNDPVYGERNRFSNFMPVSSTRAEVRA